MTFIMNIGIDELKGGNDWEMRICFNNCRWAIFANHMEPVKGFLGRYLRRKLVEEEVRMSYDQYWGF